MECPNCHCEMGTNVGICQYCGFDVTKYVEHTLRRHPPEYREPYRESYRQQGNDNTLGLITLAVSVGVMVLQLLILILLIFSLG